MEKPRTFCSDLGNLPAALRPLTSERRWLIWRWEWREKNGRGKWTKPPYQARFPDAAAKSNDPATWGSYADAVAAVAAGDGTESASRYMAAKLAQAIWITAGT